MGSSTGDPTGDPTGGLMRIDSVTAVALCGSGDATRFRRSDAARELLPDCRWLSWH